MRSKEAESKTRGHSCSAGSMPTGRQERFEFFCTLRAASTYPSENMNSSQQIPIPEKIGFMVLDQATLFPGSLLPLFIFEPRYRLMLSRALGSERIFGVVTKDPTSGEVCSVGGAGLVRACIQNEDGTSHLVLQGIARVKISRWVQLEPYRIGNVTEPPVRETSTATTEPSMRNLLSLCQLLKEAGYALPDNFQSHLAKVRDPGVFSDILASSLIECPELRQRLLEELDVEERLRLLEDNLTSLLA